MWPLIFCQYTIYQGIWPSPGTLLTASKYSRTRVPRANPNSTWGDFPLPPSPPHRDFRHLRQCESGGEGSLVSLVRPCWTLKLRIVWAWSTLGRRNRPPSAPPPHPTRPTPARLGRDPRPTRPNSSLVGLVRPCWTLKPRITWAWSTLGSLLPAIHDQPQRGWVATPGRQQGRTRARAREKERETDRETEREHAREKECESERPRERVGRRSTE